MKLFAYFLCSWLPGIFLSQDTWRVSLNNKTLLSTSVENADKNIVVVPSSQLRQASYLAVRYTEANKKKKWERTIALYNDQDAELYHQEGSQLKIKTGELSRLFKDSRSIKIYTWSLPTDPQMKQIIRIRRIHLCTLLLK